MREQQGMYLHHPKLRYFHSPIDISHNSDAIRWLSIVLTLDFHSEKWLTAQYNCILVMDSFK